MTRKPQTRRRPRTERPHAQDALARAFNVAALEGPSAPGQTTAPEPAVEEAERRAALGRVFGTHL